MHLILVSACLLGSPVRFDGSAKSCDNKILRRWMREGRVVPVCPEVAGGLSVPRPAVEIADGAGGMRVIAGQTMVLNSNGDDVTAEFLDGARFALREAQHKGIKIAVLKEGSPSCGSGYIYDGTFTSTRIHGTGVTTALLRQSGIVVFSEAQIGEANELLLRQEAATQAVAIARETESDMYHNKKCQQPHHREPLKNSILQVSSKDANVDCAVLPKSTTFDE